MSGHVFAFDCPHCAATIAHRGSLRLGVAACTSCGAQFRVDVHVAALLGPQMRRSPVDAVTRDPDAPFTELITLMMGAA